MTTATATQQTGQAQRLAAELDGLHQKRLVLELALKNLPGRDFDGIKHAIEESPATMLEQLRLVAEAKNLEQVYRDALVQLRSRIERVSQLAAQNS